MTDRIDPTAFVCAGCGSWLTRDDDAKGECSTCGALLVEDPNLEVVL